MAAPAKVVFFTVVLSFVVISVYDVLTNFEENNCQMTWMYEYPSYIPAKLKQSVQQRFPRYGLYLYGEGAYAERISNFHLSGIPVLFIPGNAGSYKQVRSLGSVALRKAETFRQGLHFNYFAVDLNEELSGLFGGVLQEQTEFVHECIKHILTLYKKVRRPPSSVVIVGHSMGGVIARGLFMLADFDPQLVHTIITQATPHQSPVIPLDYSINDYYSRVNAYWMENGTTTLNHVTVFSTGGGYRDLLVRSGLTSVQQIVADNRSVSSVTMSIPRAWVSTDHLCIVWCNEFVLATKRAMFDLIDVKTGQITTDPEYRVRVFQHHFHHNPGYAFTFDPPSSVGLKSIKWEVKDQLQWSFTRDEIKKTRYLVVPVVQGLSFVAVTTIPGDTWIVGCIDGENIQQCSEGVNLSPITRLIAPAKLGRKMIVLNEEDLLDFTHLLISVPVSRTKVEISAELFNMTERTVTFHAPGFWSSVFAGPVSLISPGHVIPVTQPGAMFYNVTVAGLGNIWQAIQARLVSTECSQNTQLNVVDGSLMTLSVPWNMEDVTSYSSSNETDNLISAKLMMAKPVDFSDDPSVLLLLNPSCTYSVSMAGSFQETLGQVGRFCGSLLPVFIVVNLLMTLGQQLCEPDAIKSFADSHQSYADNWRLVPWVSLISYILKRDVVHWFLAHSGIPDDDLVSLGHKRISFGLMVILLYLIGYVLVRIHTVGVEVVVSSIGTVIRLYCGCPSSSFAATLLVTLQSAVLLGALYLALFYCGAAALLVVLILALLKAVAAFTRQSPSRHIQLTLLLLLLWLLILNGPSCIVWLKNFRFSTSLKTDPSKLPSLICCTLMLVSSLLPHHVNSYGNLWSRRVMHFLCLGALLYAMESVYRLPYIICVGLGIYVLTQLHSVVKGEEQQAIDGSDSSDDGDDGNKKSK